LGTKDTGQINVREYRRGNAKGPVSLDCPFSFPLRYSLTFICPVSCVLYVASFSGLSFFITPSVFSNIYLEKLATLGTQDTGQINVREYEGEMKKDNPEKLAT
jgi:hypothetical protein